MSKLLFNAEDILIVNPHLAKLIGLNEAIVLQQIHYWVNNKGCTGVQANGRKWIYNTVSQWQEQFPFFSPSTIKRTMIELRDLGLISIEQLSENGRDKTNYYSINYDKLDAFDTVHFEQSRVFNLNSLDGSSWSPPNSTETTTENKVDRKRSLSSKKTLQTYLQECKDKQVKPISDEHPSRKFAAKAGIPGDILGLMWMWFKENYTTGTGANKKYADWGLVFNNAVKGNWGGLWYVDRNSGEVLLSNNGLLYKASVDADN